MSTFILSLMVLIAVVLHASLAKERNCSYSISSGHSNKLRITPGNSSCLKYDLPSGQQTTEALLSDYFNAVGCARIAGIDFMMAKSSQWPPSTILSTLPRSIRRPKEALSESKALSAIKSKCRACSGACLNGSWLYALQIVKKYMHKAATAAIQDNNLQTKINRATDLVSVVPAFPELLPVIPDVAIQFSCSDINDTSTKGYVLAPFVSVLDLIPKGSRYIYILWDKPHLSQLTSANKSVCRGISTAFFDQVSTRFPCSTVVLKRVGNHVLTFARYSLANTTICSSGTICFWPAIANKNQVYLPASVSMGGATLLYQPNISNVVRYAPQLSIPSFPGSAPVDDILSTLRGEGKGRTGSATTTVITSYYQLSSTYSLGSNDVWISNFMQMNFKVVVYCDEESKEYLAKLFPPTDDRVYVLRPFSSFNTSRWDWKSEEPMDPVRGGNGALLYQIRSEKVFMVADAAQRNIFNTSTFAWVDIGCFRDADLLPRFKGFPDNTKFDRSKVTFVQSLKFTREEKKNLNKIDSRFTGDARIDGTMFAGGKRALLQFMKIFVDAVSEAKAQKVFAGRVQSLFAFSVLRNPGLLDTVEPILLHAQWASSANSTRSSCPPRSAGDIED